MTAALLILAAIPQLTLHQMPAGHAYKVPRVGEVRYFLLEEYKELVRMDNELYLARQEIKALEILSINQGDVIFKLGQKVESVEAERDIFKTRADRLNLENASLSEDLAKCQGGFPFLPMALGIAGGFAAGALLTLLFVAVT